MNYLSCEDRDLWSLVLAGGNGERLKPFIKLWLGWHKPKQYCTFVGTRSMFQHTLDRSDRIISPERRVTVVARDHSDEAMSQFASRAKGKVILQPANRDTAAGIFLGIAHIRAYDPKATVLIFPSDHFVYPEERFVEIAHSMAHAARFMKHWIFLLGVSPDYPEREYGWIQPGAHLGWFSGCQVRGTKAFLEKPSLAGCRAAMRSGSLWNTMVMAAKVETLWNLGLHCLPEVMSLLEIYGESIGSVQENVVLESIYEAMPNRNFSAHLLQQSPRHVMVMELRGVLWSDWGDPGRITATLQQLGREQEVYGRCMAAAG